MFRANHGEAKPSPSKVVPPLWKKGEACLPACPRSSGAKHSMQLNLSGVGASDRDDTAKPDKVGFSHVRVIYRVVSDLLQFVELGFSVVLLRFLFSVRMFASHPSQPVS